MLKNNKSASFSNSTLTPADKRDLSLCVFVGCAAAVLLVLAALCIGLALQRRREAAQTERLLNVLSARLSAAAAEAYPPDALPELFLFDPAAEVLYPLEDGQTGSVGLYELEISAADGGYTLRLAPRAG